MSDHYTGVTPSEFARLMQKRARLLLSRPSAISVIEARLFLDRCVTCGLLTRTLVDGAPHYMPTSRLIEAFRASGQHDS